MILLFYSRIISLLNYHCERLVSNSKYKRSFLVTHSFSNFMSSVFRVFNGCRYLKSFKIFVFLTKIFCSFSLVAWLWESSSSNSFSICLSLFTLTEMEVAIKSLMVIRMLFGRRKTSRFLLLWCDGTYTGLQYTFWRCGWNS